MRVSYISSILAAIAFAASASAGTTFTTVPSWNGSDYVFPWAGTPTYGETLVAPGGTLNNVTFYLNGAAGGSVPYVAQVYSWTGNLIGGNGPQGATGAPLYQSAVQTFFGNGTFEAVSFDPNVALTAGDHYVVDLEALGGYSVGQVVWGAVPSHPAGDGGGGYNFDNFLPNNNGNWDDFGYYNYGDLAYTANFGATTPAPAAIAPFALGLLGVLRRRARG